MSARRAAIVAAAMITIGCGTGRSSGSGGGALSGSAQGAGARGAGIELRLDLAEDRRALGVEIRVTGPAVASVKALRATRGWADTHPLVGMRDLRVSDAAGTIEVGAPVEEERFTALPLARPITGDEVIVRYTARANAEVSRLSLHRGPAGVSGVGHAFVVRPAIEGEMPLTIHFHAAELGSTAALATSLDGRARASVEDLATAVYVAGSWTSDASQTGPRRALAMGSKVDLQEAAGVAGLVRMAFVKAFGIDERDLGDPPALFVIGERGIGADHDGASTGGAMALWIDGERALDDAAKILVAHEASHRAFGGLLRVGIEGYEAAWFTEGFATYYARRTLFDERAITAESFSADLARTDGDRSAEAHAGDRRAAEYSRGSRYAAALDHALRRASGGARSLDDVVRAMVAAAQRTKGAPMSVEDFRAIVRGFAGAATERALWEGLVANRPLDLPDGAFGPCFKRVVDERTVPDLGFDASSLAERPQIVRGVVPDSAASRAGLTDGALILKSSLRPGQEIDPRGKIELVVSQSRGKKRIVYTPARTTRQIVFKPQECSRKSR